MLQCSIPAAVTELPDAEKTHLLGIISEVLY